MFLERLLEDLFSHWRFVFAQQRTANRARKVAIGLLLGMGRRTITRALCFHGQTEEDWSADYKIFSRSRWDEQALFNGIVPQLVESGYLKRDLVAVAWDDTAVPRSGKRVPGGQWMRDSMGPPFHVNLIWGQRYLQASATVKKSIIKNWRRLGAAWPLHRSREPRDIQSSVTTGEISRSLQCNVE